MTDDLEGMGVELVTARPRTLSSSSDTLVGAYERCLRKSLESHWAQPISLPRVRRSSTAAHAAVLRVDPKGKVALDRTSYFLSLVYAGTRERVITYDLPLPLDKLGSLLNFRSRPKTVLVNRGTIGEDSGADFGFVVNDGISPPPICHGLYVDLSLSNSKKRGVDEVLVNGLYVNPARGVVRGCAVLNSLSLTFSLFAPSPDELANNATCVPRVVFPEKDFGDARFMHWRASEARNYRNRLRYQPNAGQNLVAWLSEIEELAAKRPEELIDRYGKGRWGPSHYAKTELFTLLFKNWGDI